MDNTYYETLDENFTQALNLYQTEYSHQQLLEFLKNGNIVQRQVAALKFDSINNVEDAKVLMANLTGQDGKIREVVSLRLDEFMSNPDIVSFFVDEQSCRIFLDAIIDINGNICRNIISAIANLKTNENFCKNFCPKLIDLTSKLIEIVSKFDFSDGKYKVNKEAFKLYWCLETIYEFFVCIDIKDIKAIVMKSKDIGEYTIREKIAKILTNDIKDEELLNIKNELKSDSNYYVRRF